MKFLCFFFFCFFAWMLCLTVPVNILLLTCAQSCSHFLAPNTPFLNASSHSTHFAPIIALLPPSKVFYLLCHSHSTVRRYKGATEAEQTGCVNGAVWMGLPPKEDGLWNGQTSSIGSILKKKCHILNLSSYPSLRLDPAILHKKLSSSACICYVLKSNIVQGSIPALASSQLMPNQSACSSLTSFPLKHEEGFWET